MKYFPVFFLLITFVCFTEAKATLVFDLDSPAVKIRDRSRCKNEISDGAGDLIGGPVLLRGKCSGNALAPIISRDSSGSKYIAFNTTTEMSSSKISRTELALTEKWFKFRTPVFIGFKIMIPHESDISDKFFYLMQWWQCAPNSPIAGLRLERGTSHVINFMTRGDDRAASMKRVELVPGEWSLFVIKGVVDPFGSRSEFSVWDERDAEPDTFSGPYGYAKKFCNGTKEIPQQFRLKFGIYKGAELGRKFTVGYGDIRIGKSFESVNPWE